MSDSERLAEVKRLVEEWAGKKGDDRCWYYPEIFLEIAAVVGASLTIRPELLLICQLDFEDNCRRFSEEQYHSETISTFPGEIPGRQSYGHSDS